MKNARRTPKAVIFDMDGTITRPYLDFAKIKRELGCGDGILEFVETLEPVRRREAMAKVHAWQRDGAEASTLNPGVRELLELLRKRGIRTAILTRNDRASVEIVLARHSLAFDAVVTADDRLPPKPSPEPVRHIAASFGVDPRETWVVGDFRYDIESGRAAGATTVFLRTSHSDDGGAGADYSIDRLDELTVLLGEAT